MDLSLYGDNIFFDMDKSTNQTIMNISIFTVGSVTTAEEESMNPTIMREYFRGMFRPVGLFAGELEEFGDVDLHILSHEFGYVRGDDVVDKAKHHKDSVESMQKSLLRASKNSDVLIIALMKEQYEKVAKPVWETVIENLHNIQILGVSAPETVQKWLNLKEIEEAGCEVIVYNKVGPALVSNEFKHRVLDVVESRR